MAKYNFPTRKIKSKATLVVALIIIVVTAVSNLYSDYKSFSEAKQAIADSNSLFSVHFLDVGQGDSTLIRSPGGKYMLIDCGPTDSGEYVVKYLKDLGVEVLDYLLITHPHEDHYGGAERGIGNFGVETLIIHEAFADEYPYDMFIDELEDSKYTDKAGIHFAKPDDSFLFDNCAEFMIIAPEKADTDNLNNSSICLKMIFGSTSFLFTGDAEKQVEREMLANGYNLSADVYQAGHHGSSTSNTAAFVEEINPQFAVISCERNNDYGHPHKETLETFKELGVQVLRTDEMSDIVIFSDGENVIFSEDFLELGATDVRDENILFEYIKSFCKRMFA